MKQHSIKKNYIKNFAQPLLCRLLAQKGLTTDVAFKYRVYDNERVYVTDSNSAFDYLGLYSLDLSNEHTHVQYEEVPAYSIQDIETFLPDYLIAKNNGKYQVNISDIYPEVKTQEHERLADAMAKILIELINKVHISPELLNLYFTNKI